jgi:hypothetical protein
MHVAEKKHDMYLFVRVFPVSIIWLTAFVFLLVYNQTNIYIIQLQHSVKQEDSIREGNATN